MFLSLSSNKTGATYGAGTVHHSGEPEITTSFYFGSSCLDISFLSIILPNIVCPIVCFLLAIVLFCCFDLRAASNYPYGMLKLCSCKFIKSVVFLLM